jgi:hypothetical protein
MKRIDRMIVAVAFCLAGAVLAASAFADDPADQTGTSAQPASSMSGSASTQASGSKDAQTVIALWPDKSKAAAQALIDKYGPPDMVSEQMLSWSDREKWKMVGAFRDAVSIKDPAPSEVTIVNKVSYRVPEGKVGALAHFDHALVVDQLRGTLAANGDSEQHNILALNLAVEIVTGKRDVASAKSFLKKTLMESMAGKSSPYLEGLMFNPSSTPEKGIEPAAPENPKLPLP